MVLRAPSSLGREFTHIYSDDPALDKEHKDYDHEIYTETGDLKYLPTLDDEALTVFHCRGLRGRVYQKVAEGVLGTGTSSQIDALAVAVSFGLIGADNLEDVRISTKKTTLGACLTDATINKLLDLDLGRLVMELGWRIMAESSESLPKKP